MKRILFLALPTFVALAGCSGMPEIPSIASALTPYHIDVRQGNLVTQEMMAQIKVGQTKDQVRFILGTPLVTDMFHADRWDYIYRFQPGRGEAQQRRMAVYFKDGKLSRVSGDVVANESVAVTPASQAQGSPNVEARTERMPAVNDTAREPMKLEPTMAAPVAR